MGLRPSHCRRCRRIKVTLATRKSSTAKALTAWTVGQNIVTRIGKLTTARFDKIDALLNLTRRSLKDENRRLQNLRTSDYTAQRIIIITT